MLNNQEQLNKAIRDIPIPARMAHLPISERGFPVPWFVARVDGKWDFRVIDTPKVGIAYSRKLCWLCGQPLGQYLAFVIGPMCSINRVSAEPPSHRDCAEYAVKACPFLSQPRMRRNDHDLPVHQGPPGIMIAHNPGVMLLWITKSYRPIRDHAGGVLFEVGPPLETIWYTEGRFASREEIQSSINKGLPYLRQQAEIDGIGGKIELEKRYAQAMKLLPV